MNAISKVRQLMADPLSIQQAKEAIAMMWGFHFQAQSDEVKEALNLLRHHMDQHYQYTDDIRASHILKTAVLGGKPYSYLGTTKIHFPTDDGPVLKDCHIWADARMDCEIIVKKTLKSADIEALFEGLKSGRVKYTHLHQKNAKVFNRRMKAKSLAGQLKMVDYDKPNATTDLYFKDHDSIVDWYTAELLANQFPTYEELLVEHNAPSFMVRSTATVLA